MAMLITKFNKLIANKFVWIGFTFLIVVAFAFMGMAGSGDARDRADRQAAGTLFGESISAETFRRAYANTYMGVLLAVGQQISITEEVDRELRRMTWKRLASLMKAEQMGLRTSDREVVAAIRSYPMFQQNGRFSTETYQQFVNQYLMAMGFSAGQFEEHVAEELVLDKLRQALAQAVWIPPAEIDQAIRTLGDSFEVSYVRIDDDAVGEIDPLETEAVRAFFENDPERFMRPAQVQVRFVRFPVEAFEDEVEITEEQVRAHYDLNQEMYTREEVAETPDDHAEEDDDLFRITTTIPFEEVQAEIEESLRREAAARRAADVAMDFVVSLIPDRHGEAASFEAAAETFNRDIESLPPFDRHTVPEGIDAGPDFVRAAFDLRPHAEYYFSDPVEGEEYLYVIALDERIPERVPEFEEVADEVRQAAEQAERARQRTAWAEGFVQTAKQHLADGESWSDVAQQFDLSASTPLRFSAADGLAERPYGNQLVRAVLAHNAGEITEPVRVGNAYLVVYVQERDEVDPMLYADFRPQIAASLAQERAAVLFGEWQQQLLQEAEFTTADDRETPLYDDDEWDEG